MGGPLFSCLLLLSGEVERATRLLSLPPIQREREVSGSILVPYLLVSASKALDGAEHASIWASSYLITVNWSASMYERFGTPDKEGIPTLAELFASRIGTEAPDPAALESRIEAALGQLGRDVDAIVTDNRRGEYPKATEWLAHGARALSLARGDKMPENPGSGTGPPATRDTLLFAGSWRRSGPARRPRREPFLHRRRYNT
ncbi:hypothetical protein DQ353_20030 [Arthrobacter sp. AQ5-05]|uniref:hypothetical protein n=1 Tax=Arthrobacter sp. AQ5-05 TaxID=2184581 RepID=UPI000DCF00EB|nr:hypothetical protein [Arthrobacter sp. AQ5-05]RAX46573.1 hypothetical protein DQ353_20030 [Arthrobacter sp. AQ5-05]